MHRTGLSRTLCTQTSSRLSLPSTSCTASSSFRRHYARKRPTKTPLTSKSEFHPASSRLSDLNSGSTSTLGPHITQLFEIFQSLSQIDPDAAQRVLSDVPSLQNGRKFDLEHASSLEASLERELTLLREKEDAINAQRRQLWRTRSVLKLSSDEEKPEHMQYPDLMIKHRILDPHQTTPGFAQTSESPLPQETKGIPPGSEPPTYFASSLAKELIERLEIDEHGNFVKDADGNLTIKAGKRKSSIYDNEDLLLDPWMEGDEWWNTRREGSGGTLFPLVPDSQRQADSVATELPYEQQRPNVHPDVTKVVDGFPSPIQREQVFKAIRKMNWPYTTTAVNTRKHLTHYPFYVTALRQMYLTRAPRSEEEQFQYWLRARGEEEDEEGFFEDAWKRLGRSKAAFEEQIEEELEPSSGQVAYDASSQKFIYADDFDPNVDPDIPKVDEDPEVRELKDLMAKYERKVREHGSPLSRTVVHNHPPVLQMEKERQAEDDLDLRNDLESSVEDPEKSADEEDVRGQALPMPQSKYFGFMQFSLVVKRVVQQTGKGKIPSMYALIVMGNGDGFVGYGEGKHEEATLAIEQARIAAVRNLDYVERFEKRTVWTEMRTKLASTQIILRPRPMGFGLATNPYIHQVLKAAGIKDASAKVWGSRNPVYVIKALFRMIHAGNAPLAMGNGVGGKARKLDKGAGMRGKEAIERARGRKLVDLRTS